MIPGKKYRELDIILELKHIPTENHILVYM